MWTGTNENILNLSAIIGAIILGIVFTTFGLLGFKSIPLTQTLAAIVYTAVCSFIFNDLIKFFLKIASKKTT